MKYIILLLTLISIVGCTKDHYLGEDGSNLFANAGRTSSYEDYDSFRGYTDVIDIETRDSSGGMHAPLPLSKNFAVISTTAGTIILTYNYKVIWEKNFDSTTAVASGMAADKNSNIYYTTLNGFLYSISIDGELNWKKEIIAYEGNPIRFSDVLMLTDGLIVASNQGKVLKYDFDGEIIWERTSSYSPTRVFAADSLGNIALTLSENRFGGTDSLIYISGENGESKWAVELSEFRFITGSVVFGDRIYLTGVRELFGERISELLIYDLEGKLVLERQLSFYARNLSVDKSGNIYAIGYNSGIGEALSGIYCISPKGELLWQNFYETASVSPAMISETNIVFIGSGRKGVGAYFVSKQTGQLIDVISLSNVPIVYLEASVNRYCEILFNMANKRGIVKVGKVPFGGTLPF